jgi:hypothetical protein
MRILRVLTALLIAIGLSTLAQADKATVTLGGHTRKDPAPKSTVPAKGGGAARGTASSKKLQSLEREKVKSTRTPREKKPATRTVAKVDKRGNAAINFCGKGGKVTEGKNRSGGLKGRLKEKGKGRH